MPAQPTGEQAPADGRLPEAAIGRLGARPFGVYVHVPFCATRCGYCDFNTYTADELGTTPGASRAGWADAVLAEWRLARTVLGASRPPIDTVFFGGGTPTLLPPADLLRVLDALRDDPGLADDAEVSVEANPETLTPQTLAALRSGGVTRLSMGMQSATRARAGRPRPGAHPGAGGGSGHRRPSSRFRQPEPRPDLRDAGGVVGRLGAHR